MNDSKDPRECEDCSEQSMCEEHAALESHLETMDQTVCSECGASAVGRGRVCPDHQPFRTAPDPCVTCGHREDQHGRHATRKCYAWVTLSANPHCDCSAYVCDPSVRLRARHIELGLLVAEYMMIHRDALPSKTSAMDLLRWSNEQAYGRVAQVEERRIEDASVGGSTPFPATVHDFVFEQRRLDDEWIETRLTMQRHPDNDILGDIALTGESARRAVMQFVLAFGAGILNKLGQPTVAKAVYYAATHLVHGDDDAPTA